MNWKKFLAKVQSALFPNAVKPPVVPVPDVPAPVVEFGEQLCFVGFQYHWDNPAVADVDAFVRKCAWDRLGVSCEIMALRVSGDIDAVGAEMVRKLAPWVAAVRKYGTILKVSNNSNDTLNPAARDDTFVKRLQLFKTLYGTANVLLQPMSEDDNKCPAHVRAATRAWAAANWPADQLVDMVEHLNGGRYVETHSSNGGNLHPGRNVLVVTDNNMSLLNKIGEPAMVDLARARLADGYSFEAYGFQSSLSDSFIAGMGQALRGAGGVSAPSPVPPDPVTADMLAARGFREGAALPVLSSLVQSHDLVSAGLAGRLVTFNPGNPFGEGAFVCLLWAEDGKWFWSDAEGLHAGSTGTNYANNLFPVEGDARKPGRCREKNGTAHFPRKGAAVWAFIADAGLKWRTAIRFAGMQ